MTIGPDHQLYISDYYGQIWRYEFAAQHLSKFIDANAGGRSTTFQIAFGPDGNLYAGSLDTRSVIRYNGVTGAYIDTFAQSDSNHQINAKFMAFGPDGNLYVAANGMGSGIMKLDGTNGQYLGTINLPYTIVFGFTFGPDGTIYFSKSHSDAIWKVDSTTGAVVGTFTTGFSLSPSELHFGPDGDLYVLNTGGLRKIVRFNGTNGAYESAIVGSDQLIAATSFAFTNVPEPASAGACALISLISARSLRRQRKPLC